MLLRAYAAPFFAIVAGLAACYTGSDLDTNRAPNVAVDGSPTEPEKRDAGRGNTPSATTPEGLPCDVTEFLKTACNNCHGTTLKGGAPNRLMSHSDLAAKSKADPKKTVAQISLERMKSEENPMPPAGVLSSSTISVFENWVKNGLKKGTCATNLPDPEPEPEPEPEPQPEPDAGPGEPQPQPTVCTSGKTNAMRSGLMRPGKTCISCHESSGGPAFSIGGTVYPTFHEPDMCHGAGNITVQIIDVNGKLHTFTTNATGNFFAFAEDEPIPGPYRARIISGNKVRDMQKLQTNGDCNACHTERGTNGAPGRIMAP